MTYQYRGKQEAKLVEWSGCFWTIILTVVIGSVVYFGFYPFVRVITEQVDMLSIIGGF